MKATKLEGPEFPKTVTVRGISGINATIYRQERTKPDKDGKPQTYTSFLVGYSLLGKRKLESFAKLAEAEQAAKDAIVKIANGKQAVLELTNRDRDVYTRARDYLAPHNVDLDVAAKEYAEILTILAGHGSPIEAVRHSIATRKKALPKILALNAVKEMIAQEEAQQDGKRRVAWVKLLKAHLENKFAVAFNCNIDAIEPKEINKWLIRLDCSERTKKNARDCLAHFFKWCKAAGYLHKEADPLAHVQDFRKRRRGKIHILIPEDLRKLFSNAGPDLLPYIALRAFAGLRDSEAAAIDWKHIDLAGGWIEITEDVAKASDDSDGTRRLVPVRDCLKAWLTTHWKPEGRVCPFENTAKQIAALCDTAGVKWERNCLRHSQISYAVAESNDIPAVAIHSGNSPAVIRQHYLRVVKPDAAKAWFSLRPDVNAKQGKDGKTPAAVPLSNDLIVADRIDLCAKGLESESRTT